VTIVPTTIDTDKYLPGPAREGGLPVIGWTGSHSTRRYLEIVRPVLERLRKRLAFRMVVVGTQGFEPEGVEVEHRPWRSATEVQDLSDLDIGLMPLADSEWERGKCGLKALVYMALAIPAVVSPVGVSADIVEHGVNGLVAGSEPEWEDALGHLLRDAALRRRMGSAGRLKVEATYSARVQAPRVAEVLKAAGS
jgi:glycosyltransferase involved in cell wall biosynthesis